MNPAHVADSVRSEERRVDGPEDFESEIESEKILVVAEICSVM